MHEHVSLIIVRVNALQITAQPMNDATRAARKRLECPLLDGSRTLVLSCECLSGMVVCAALVRVEANYANMACW